MEGIHTILNRTMTRNSTSGRQNLDLLLKQLRVVQANAPSYKVIHIAGTKGKFWFDLFV